MNYFFTSDTHFGHANIIKYSNRPFKNTEHMNEMLITNWNSVVKPSDTVFHLGDLGFTDEDVLIKIVERLNGQKFFLYGNHDKTVKRSKKLQSLFVKVCDYYELYVEDATVISGRQFIVMSHYAMLQWNKSHHGAMMLHGHDHGTLEYPFNGRIMDVGTDPQKYFPISYEQVKAQLIGKPGKAHHGRSSM